MQRILLAAAVATVALGFAAADAAPRHKQRARAAHTAAVPPRAPQIGPAWAGPNQCWTDEGYGRFAPCDGGGKAM